MYVSICMIWPYLLLVGYICEWCKEFWCRQNCWLAVITKLQCAWWKSSVVCVCLSMCVSAGRAEQIPHCVSHWRWQGVHMWSWSWWSTWPWWWADTSGLLSLWLLCAALVMAALCNRAGHYIFALWFLSIYLFSSSSFFPRLISAVGDWMSTILLHMVWP